jgi:hypothetical protein
MSLRWAETDNDEHFLGADTFSHDDDDKLLPKVPGVIEQRNSGRTDSSTLLLLVAASRIAAGFLLGRRKQ